jgi:hypothetical protein
MCFVFAGSPNFLESFEDSVEAGVEHLNIQLCQSIYSATSSALTVKSENSKKVVKQPRMEDFYECGPVPFAKVIPQLNKVSKGKLLDCSLDTNEFLGLFVELQSAAAFYEAIFMQ